MPSRKPGESAEAYRARNRAIYEARKRSARTRGSSLSQATGKARRARQPAIGDLHIDFRFRSVKEFFERTFRRGQPLPDLAGPPVDAPSVAPPPPGMRLVSIFVTADGASAVYPDGRVRRGSVDAIYAEAKATGLAVVVTSGNPPKRRRRAA